MVLDLEEMINRLKYQENKSKERKTGRQGSSNIRPFAVGVILIGVEEVAGLVIVLTLSQSL